MPKQFSRTGGLLPGRSTFDLSHEMKFTCDMGQLIPVQVDEVIPGDVWIQGIEGLFRFQPTLAPLMHQVDVYFHSFYVPNRIMIDEWEDFITRGVSGDETVVLPEFVPEDGVDNIVGTLWDYFGFPIGVDPDGAYPLDLPWRAYNLVYNEYYRDPTLMTEVALDQNAILNRCWEKDYFTSSLPNLQRGTAPALPISGTSVALWPDSAFVNINGSGGYSGIQIQAGTQDPPNLYVNSSSSIPADNLREFFQRNSVDLSSATTFDVADLRLVFQIQKWMERNSRAGPRYVEQLRAHWGVSPKDERLQRPEYIGGAKSPIIFSEVLQTSETGTSPQGNLAGHGLGAASSFIGKYRVEEYGVIITMMSIMPKPAYSQGIPRQWLRKTTFEWPFPEFVNLSEQAITNAEICATNSASHNAGIFGYIGRYDELRVKQSKIVGEMRTVFDYWHLGRQFDTAAPPALNADFVECIPRKDIFAVQDVPAVICTVGNSIRAIRPIPIMSEPGLIDHN